MNICMLGDLIPYFVRYVLIPYVGNSMEYLCSMLGDLIPYFVRCVLILWESWVKASKNHGNFLRDNPKQSLDNNLDI